MSAAAAPPAGAFVGPARTPRAFGGFAAIRGTFGNPSTGTPDVQKAFFPGGDGETTVRGLANTILAAMFAVFLVLGVVWAVMGSRSPNAPIAAAGVDPTVHSVGAQWRDGELRVEMVLQNSGRHVSPGRIEYTLELAGRVVAEGSAGPVGLPGDILPGEEWPLHFDIQVPGTAGIIFWEAQDGNEPVRLELEGVLALQAGDGMREADFEWTSRPGSGRTALLTAVQADGSNCSEGSSRLCMAGIEPEWRSDGMGAQFTLRNPSSRTVLVEEGTVTLRLGGTAVATATLPAGLGIDAGSHGLAASQFTFEAAALADWWSDHVEDCESSSVSLEAQLVTRNVEADGDAGRAISVRWRLDADDGRLLTGMACGESP